MKMTTNDMQLPDLKALVSFGRLGFKLLAVRMMTMTALIGILALSGYVAYNPTWQGAACVGIVALLVFQPALKAETKSNETTGG